MASFERALEKSVEYFGGDALAAHTFVSKYALRDNTGELLETTPDDMHRRLATEFARIEAKYPNPMGEDEIFDYLRNFKYIVPQGSPQAGIGNPYQIQSISNCFVIDPPMDSYGGICHTDQEMVQIMKRRGGVGTSVSRIRPKGMRTSNAAQTTDGIGSYMQRYSNSTREVAQDGRRGALMLTCDGRHPEIETFIDIKRDKKKVTGANVSLQIYDDFMHAVESGGQYQLQWPVDSTTPQMISFVTATSLWDKIVDAAWSSAEPGVLFWDNVRKYSPADIYETEGFGSVSTNPCITGDTLIAVADGRNAVSISQLAAEGVDVPVYSVCPSSKQVQIKMGKNPRLTQKAADVWKLKLDDGTVFRATHDHKIMKLDGEYVQLKDLKRGDSVFPFNTFVSNKYRQIVGTGAAMSGGARRNRRQYRLIYEFVIGQIYEGYELHHADFNSRNDRIDNLVLMSADDHRHLHADKMMGELNPYHDMSDEWKHSFASHPGETNGRYSGITNAEIIAHGKALFSQCGKITRKIWQQYASLNRLPQHLSNKFRFGSWSNFKNQIATNHKVVSVEFDTVEDVYNITVDDNHNYCVITSGEDDFMTSSGFCVKNCGEIPLSPYDSCRLLLVNLASFVTNPFTENASFDWKYFSAIVQRAQRLMDDMVDLEIEQVDKILAKIASDPQPDRIKRTERELWETIRAQGLRGRRTGLGVTAVGDMVAYMGLRYGSDESIELVAEVYRQLCINSYTSSCIMAKERGAFPVFDKQKEIGHPFIERILSQDPALRELYDLYGRRNIANLTTAPAGSVSIETQTTSGIEPTIFIKSIRRKKINANDHSTRVDFIDDMGDRWQEYEVFHHGVKLWMDVTGESDITKSPYWNSTAEDIDWVQRVKLQAAAQKWVCHSISSTVNIPRDATKETVKEIYMAAWKAGCKGVTVYRDGCRDGVMLKADAVKKDASSVETISETKAPKRPKELPCHIVQANVKGEKWTILVGLLHDKPYEVMGGLSKYVEIPRKHKLGRLVKNGKRDGVSTYNLHFGDGEDGGVVKDIVNTFDNPNYATTTRLLSTSLRHGTPPQFIVEQLGKDKDSDMFSFSRVIARVLKTYIADGTKVTSEKECPQCHQDTLRYQEGCVTCGSCSWSKCG